MSKVHQKKRNSFLIYEFLIRTISRSLVEDDKSKSAAALKILRRYFKPGTNLYKEFRLINSLVKTTVSSEHVAASILKEARGLVETIDSDKLNHEKSILIKRINHDINDENFYDQHVSEYRTYATIQMMINEWKSSDKDLHRMAQLEDQVLKWLVTEKKEESDHVISEDTAGTARLLMKVMTKKLNEKYSGILSEQQKGLIRAYAFSTASEDQTSIKLKLAEVKQDLLTLIEQYSENIENDQYLRNKLLETKNALLSENLEQIDDSSVTRFMLYSKLKSELESKE